MKTLLLTLAIVATIASANAQVGLKDYRTGKAVATNLTDGEMLALWNSKNITCVKDGGKVLRINKAFADAGLKNKDCSKGEKTLRKHGKLGIKVIVVGVERLSKAMIEALTK